MIMSWQISGRLIEVCSCKSACPCVLGPAEPDQGWCSGALNFTIERGQSEGVDLSGRSVLWLIDLPKDFASGDGTVRLFVDDGANERQHSELEAIFSGKKGGAGEVLASLVSTWLPTQTAPISITEGEEIGFTVGGAGQAQLKPIRNGAGQVAAVINAPILGLIAIDRADLARGDGSRFEAPQMRAWESGGHGSTSPFAWSA
jgi:hypothetical protein